jgi:hypothetical protein
MFEVLKDFGHFSHHENLPLSVDRKDCLWKYYKMLARLTIFGIRNKARKVLSELHTSCWLLW